MKAIIISISPKWVAKILNGEKKLEIRKSIPKCNLPIDVYIYCTKNGGMTYKYEDSKYHATTTKNYFPHYCINGKVVAKFTLYETEEIKWENCPFHEHWEYATKSMWEEHILDGSGLTFMELHDYLCNCKGYVWYIEKLEIFDNPKDISEFKTKLHIKGGCKNCPQYTGFSMPNCATCDFLLPLTRAPQSWCYIEV